MKKRDIIIVTFCVVATLVCIAVTFCGNIKNNGVLTTDSFIGIMATLIGVCATIVVGFQIASFIKIHETERQLQEVKEENKKLHQLQNEIRYLEGELANAFTLLSDVLKKDVHKALAKILSLSCLDPTSEPSITLRIYEGLKKKIDKLDSQDKEKLSQFVYKLKEIEIPGNIEHYTEIMKLHIDIISTLENSVKGED